MYSFVYLFLVFGDQIDVCLIYLLISGDFALLMTTAEQEKDSLLLDKRDGTSGVSYFGKPPCFSDPRGKTRCSSGKLSPDSSAATPLGYADANQLAAVNLHHDFMTSFLYI